MSRTRALDWRFFLSLAFLLMSSYLVWIGVSAVQEKARLATENTSLRADAAIDRAAATAERKVLLDKQNELLDQVADLQDQYGALLDYLRDQGIVIPERLTSSGARSQNSSRSGSPPKAQANPGPATTKKSEGSKKSCKKSCKKQTVSLTPQPPSSLTQWTTSSMGVLNG